MGFGKFVVIDVETTGFSPADGDRVVELALVGLDPRRGVEWQWSTLLDPGCDPGPSRIHGVTRGMVSRAPRFAQVAGYAAHLMRGRVPVAHNAPFDARFIEAEFSLAGWRIPLSRPDYLCTRELAARWLPYGRRGLASCCDAFGISNDRPHEALADASATAHLLLAMLATSRLRVPRAISASHWPAIPIFDTAGLPREMVAV